MASVGCCLGNCWLSLGAARSIGTFPTKAYLPRYVVFLAAVRWLPLKVLRPRVLLVFESLPADRLDAAKLAARTGQDPSATLLPLAKAADWSAVKELPEPAGKIEWKVGTESAAVPKGKLGFQPITLKGLGRSVVRIHFSRPDVGRVAVLTTNLDELGGQKQVSVDHYDLVDGKHLGGLDLFRAELAKNNQLALDADLSPDGSLLAVREPKEGKRLDIWSLTAGKHVVGWLPGEKDAAVLWFAFVDEKQVLTLSSNGKLTLWDVPECRAVYSIPARSVRPALIPGRKYMAVFAGSNFEVMETATGETSRSTVVSERAEFVRGGVPA